jgi:hypothetical protein
MAIIGIRYEDHGNDKVDYHHVYVSYDGNEQIFNQFGVEEDYKRACEYAHMVADNVMLSSSCDDFVSDHPDYAWSWEETIVPKEKGWSDNDKVILSLFDYTGAWCKPYREAGGYRVIQMDIKHGIDILKVDADYLYKKYYVTPEQVHGILAAPPCTDFSVSGAQYWPAKDKDGRTAASMALVQKVLDLVDMCQPEWWVLENPVGRLPKLFPSLGKPWYFQPHWYGDAYTKKTGLWGKFNNDLPRNDVEPIKACKQGSWLQKLGGKSEKTKMLRSMTPQGFANAFFKANP